MKQLWIFQVRQGEPFELQVKGNPIMRHDGRVSILRCLCTEKEAEELKITMEGHQCAVTMNSPQETTEQKTERRNLLQVLGGERVFPSVSCPECAWFDPYIESLCGAGLAKGVGWEDAAIEGSMSNEKFREDFEDCPLREGAIQ